MSTNLTEPSSASVDELILTTEPSGRKTDALSLRAMMDEITGEQAVVWGKTLIGYGFYHYRYDSGHEGDSFVLGFSPRKASMSVYGVLLPETQKFLTPLGPHKAGVGCLWLGSFARIDTSVLMDMIDVAWGKRATIGGQARSEG